MYIVKLGVAFGLLLSVAVNSRASEQTNHDFMADAKSAMRRANSEWSIAMRKGDAETIAKPYASDAVFVTVDGVSILGRTAIEDFYRSRLSGSTSVVSATIEQKGVASEGEGLVFEWGVGTVVKRSAEGGEVTSSGPYLTVWKREKDGHWDIIRNVVL
jgi:uncharacterized protein (TIGR02246 family)